MTNEEILKAMHERGAAGYGTAMDLARADERERIIEKIELERDNVRGLPNDYTKIRNGLFDVVIKIIKYDIREATNDK